jgi:hypothetical protein
MLFIVLGLDIYLNCVSGFFWGCSGGWLIVSQASVLGMSLFGLLQAHSSQRNVDAIEVVDILSAWHHPVIEQKTIFIPG